MKYVAPLDFTIDTVDNTCSNGASGTAMVQTTGGQAPMTYSWSNSSDSTQGINLLTSGEYNVTVTDWFGCKLTKSYTIHSPGMRLSFSSFQS